MADVKQRREAAHGTVLRYGRDGCRCDLCRAANAAKQKSWRQRFNPPRTQAQVEAEQRYEVKRKLARRVKLRGASIVAVRRHVMEG